MEGRVAGDEKTPKKRFCSRVAQVAEAGPEGVQEVRPKKSSTTATQGPVRADHAIGAASRDDPVLISLMAGCTRLFSLTSLLQVIALEVQIF